MAPFSHFNISHDMSCIGFTPKFQSKSRCCVQFRSYTGNCVLSQFPHAAPRPQRWSPAYANSRTQPRIGLPRTPTPARSPASLQRWTPAQLNSRAGNPVTQSRAQRYSQPRASEQRISPRAHLNGLIPAPPMTSRYRSEKLQHSRIYTTYVKLTHEHRLWFKNLKNQLKSVNN